tara:strand:+ start:160 stop:423 length:264 start_codon:yes stop_codon:yes gene_type:complete
MATFVERVTKSLHSDVFLVCGQENGHDAWYFVCGNAHTENKLKITSQRSDEAVALSSFGKLIHSGWGKEPGPEDMEKVKALLKEYRS